MNFEGQVAIVTGAGDGLGRSHALFLARRGAAVVVNNRIRPGQESTAQKVVDEILAFGGKAVANNHAAEDPACGQAMVDDALKAFGRVDIVICNAAMTHLEPFDKLDLADFHKTVDINLWGTVSVLHAAWPHMLKQGYGRIVLTTSTGGLYGVPNSTPYSSSKASMVGLARALTFDVPQGADIKVNVLAPSAMTKMLKGWVTEEMGAMLVTEKVTPAVAWLASSKCDRTGMVLFAAAGKVTRLRIVESEPVEMDDEFNVDWATLDSMEHVWEPPNVFDSLLKLLPGDGKAG